MKFIRPELRERYPFLFNNMLEIASGFVLIWLGAALFWRGLQFGSWVNMLVGALILAMAMLFLLVTYRAAQIRRKPEAAGIVEVTERRISYLAPTDGGIVDLDDLRRLEILTTDQGPFVEDVFWLFTLQDSTIIQIPTNAQGSEKIFDAIDGLPGADMHQIIIAMGSTQPARFLIWEPGTR